MALALLLTRLYAPLTALASARVEVMTALVSFERVFEVLDLQPLITEPDARPVPDGPVSVEFDDVGFGYPSADKVSLASLEEVATLDTRGGEEVLHGVSFTRRARAAGRAGRLVGRGQVDHRAAAVPRLYDVDCRRGAARRGRRARAVAATRSATRSAWSPRTGTCSTTRSGQPALARPEATEEELWDALRRARLADLVAACPTGWTPWSASAATGSPAASGSG